MVVDTSALVAIMGNEPERHRFNRLIEVAGATHVSAASLLETRIVLFARSGDSAVLALDAFLLKSGMIVAEVSPRIADIAFDAYRRYGKGTGHGAALNYGDCFAYALAKHLGAPLLYKGGDFSQTDIQAAASEPARPANAARSTPSVNSCTRKRSRDSTKLVASWCDSAPGRDWRVDCT